MEYRCITVGINKYYFLQPLSYAGVDAEAVRDFLTQEAKLQPQQCLLLTDTDVNTGQSTYPNRKNILYWLNRLTSESSESEMRGVLWFFFSGYGVNYRGEDYLLPIDGDLATPDTTGIAMRSLFKSLHRTGASRVVVVLDVNRSTIAGMSIGDRTVELATEMGITTILSTLPEELSYEAATLGHGVFTAALVEALRHYGQSITLSELEQYLNARLPQLGDHHWRPQQHPTIVVPSAESKGQLLLPVDGVPTELASVTLHQEISNESQTNGRLDSVLSEVNSTATVEQLNHEENTAIQLASDEQSTTEPWTTSDSKATGSHYERRRFDREDLYKYAPIARSSQQRTMIRQGKPWRLALLALAGIGLIWLIAKLNQSQTTIQSPTIIDPTSSQIEADQSTTESNIYPETGVLEANTYLSASQASYFGSAIDGALEVLPEDPLYSQAQENIGRWSQVIFDIAQGRALEEDYSAAISAAQLIPQQQRELYQEAQAAIERWTILARQQRNNQIAIEAASDLIVPNQASSYSRAIALIQQIPENQPGSKVAEQLSNQWSEQIYQLARDRADGGRWQEAIDTARLVPVESLVYDQANAAIATWQSQLSQSAQP